MTDIDITIKRSKRKTVSFEVTKELTILVKAPYHIPGNELSAMIEKHRHWMEKAIERQRTRNLLYPEPSEAEIKELIVKGKEILPQKVEYYSSLTGLVPTGIKITSAKKRFGSCSGRNSLCFSYQLMKYPDECIDYVVLHEIAHIKHHNHSKEFYAFIEKYMPDYKERVKLLRSL
ncbi:MAG: M48 family metallopeptidase [Ruminococcaceae bacterium]|nr:M48 family metallopeptidase [Oscillospiraceae bacterium]